MPLAFSTSSLPRRLRLIFAIFLAQVACLPIGARADVPSADQLRDRLLAVQQTSTLNDQALMPWHMKVSFDLLDPKGGITEHGTLEQWWAAPDRYRWTVTSPSYSATETRNAEGFFRTPVTQPLPLLLYVLHRELLSAIPAYNNITTSQPVVSRQNFGKAALDCVMLAPPRKTSDPAPPTFLFPTYCLDPDQLNLRLSAATGGQVIARNRLGHFQGKTVALDLSISEGQTLALKSSIDQLQGFTPTEQDFQPTADEKPRSDRTARVASGVIAGLKIGGPQPTYPQDAKQAHISGTVILHAIIGQDGHVYDLTPVSSPSASLTYSAVAAVRSWTYRPYILNGEPTEVETTITVNYKIS